MSDNADTAALVIESLDADGATQAATALGALLRDYGTVRSLRLDSVERWCEAHVELLGEAEVVGFRDREALLLPLHNMSGLRRGDSVSLRNAVPQVHVGEQMLGLPGEPRVDKDLPWSKVPRS